jgi:hypothetical protein
VVKKEKELKLRNINAKRDSEKIVIRKNKKTPLGVFLFVEVANLIAD